MVHRLRADPRAQGRFSTTFAFLAGAVQFAMMRAAKRDGEFIADLLPKAARLRKAQMVRVAGLAAADEAGLFGHKAQMLPVPSLLGSGRARRLLSMRERVSSFAAGSSSLVDERS